MAKRKKLLWRLGLSSLGVFAVALVALAIWMIYLDRVITGQFEGRRWTLPARVYAQPLDLYAGQALSANQLERELQRLGYQRVGTPQRPGSYRRRGERIDLISRKVQFWDEAREPQAISFVAGGNSLERMFDSRGNDVPIFRLDPLLIGSIFPTHGEDRIVVAPDEIPALLPAALKVVEDRKFDSHHGVDPLGILRAAWVNLRSGQLEQGASTLTQQLVRSYFLNNRRTWGRKIEEALMAVILEARFEKNDIMNAYINEIFLGQDGQRAVHGFGLASEFYFGKPLAELDLSEVATLVAVVRGPSYYDARRHPERVRERRDLVLDLMAEFKIVPAPAVEKAKKRALGIVSLSGRATSYYPAFLDFVRRTLRRDYREEDLTEEGLRIFTTLDPQIQANAERALIEELERLDKARKSKEKADSAGLEGVVVVTAPQSGDVMAVVGGRRVGFSGFNRALDAQRSIGSLVKPVIYLAAVESGRYNAASIIQDAPVEVKLSDGKLWRPQNISKEVFGPVPLVRALAQSLNLATVNLGLEVGLPQVTREFTRLGLGKEPPQLPAVLLGALDVTPMEVAQLYNSFANGGFRTPLRAVRAVIDAGGKPLKAFPLEVTPAADPAAVYQVNRMMVQVMERGTGRAARSRLPESLVVAGKSGTSSDYRDSWFAGFSGSHLAIVWVGYDDNRPTGLTGSSGALSVWSNLMAGIGTSAWYPGLPEGLEEVWIDFPSGQGATFGCTDSTILVPVPQGTQIPMHPDCGGAGSFGDRARDWLRGIIN